MASAIYIIAGPTAGGKSARAVELATALNGIIINADSRQIFNALPILTAQPSEEEKSALPHELYGVLPANASCSAGDWREMVEPVIHKTLAAGKTPIIVGGTGLYIKALVEGLSPMPDIPPETREAANAKQKELGNPGFHEALQRRDPIMAERLGPHNTARLIRAWEVLEATGESLAAWQAKARLAPPEDWEFRIEKIMPPRDILHRNCDARLDKMLAQGALDEVKDLTARIESGEVPPDALIARSLGFRPLAAHQRGELTRPEALTRAQGETRRYAKRQVTWFKHQL